MSDPLFSPASMTTTPRERPLIRRLRIGKWNGSGAVPGGYSLNTAPRVATRSARSSCSLG
ncbi:hypothetical protein D3C83_31370 [compost metagenome]